MHHHFSQVHPYTFRNEYDYLAWDYGADPYREYELFHKIGIDGFFTDFPWSLANYMDMTTGNSPKLQLSASLILMVVFSSFRSIWLD